MSEAALQLGTSMLFAAYGEDWPLILIARNPRKEPPVWN